MKFYLCVVLLWGYGVQGLVDDRPECSLWAKLENKTVPLQNQGHANCTTNNDCTGFNCVGIYQARELSFGMKVLPCNEEPGVEIFGYAPQFSSKNFSHVFSHEDQYDIPGSFLNASVLSAVLSQVPQLAEFGDSLRGRLSVMLKMDHTRNILVMGLTLEACVNDTCAFKMPIFNNSEIPVPSCTLAPVEVPKTNSVCSVKDIASCGPNQVCAQQSADSPIGTCQCQAGFGYEDDGSCKPNIDADVKATEEIHLDLDNDVENRRDKKAAVPLPEESLSPSPHQVEEGPSGGAVAAAVISSIVVIVLLMGAAFYIVMRTRFVPRLRARMTNTPYECANLSQPPQMHANATSIP